VFKKSIESLLHLHFYFYNQVYVGLSKLVADFRRVSRDPGLEKQSLRVDSLHSIYVAYEGRKFSMLRVYLWKEKGVTVRSNLGNGKFLLIIKGSEMISGSSEEE
jgi:hypothetical protein